MDEKPEKNERPSVRTFHIPSEIANRVGKAKGHTVLF